MHLARGIPAFEATSGEQRSTLLLPPAAGRRVSLTGPPSGEQGSIRSGRSGSGMDPPGFYGRKRWKSRKLLGSVAERRPPMEGVSGLPAQSDHSCSTGMRQLFDRGAVTGPLSPEVWASMGRTEHGAGTQLERADSVAAAENGTMPRTMNDPHVNALVFRIKHGPAVSYSDDAPAIDHDEPGVPRNAQGPNGALRTQGALRDQGRSVGAGLNRPGFAGDSVH